MIQRVSDCIFCKMVHGEMPVPRVYENEEFICIRDIHPQAKKHLLVIPKRHFASLDEAFPEGQSGEVTLMGGLLQVATHVARQEGLLPGGFRTVINTHSDGGQTVFHIHLHLLGGEPLRGSFA